MWLVKYLMIGVLMSKYYLLTVAVSLELLVSHDIQLCILAITPYSPTAEVSNPASLNKVFFFY